MEILELVNKRYQEGKPILTDKEWDELVKTLKGGEQWEKAGNVKHPYPMGTVTKIQDEETFIQLIESGWRLEPKYDGIAFDAIYVRGELKLCLTRGDGEFGLDITKHFERIEYINYVSPSDGFVRGELMCSFTTYDNFFKGKYSNPRNVVASLFNTKVPTDEIKYISAIGYDLYDKNSGFHNLGIKMGILDYENLLLDFRIYKAYGDFPIDGLIAKAERYYKIENGYRLNCVAYKPYEADDKVVTILKEIEWEISRHGKLTPVGNVSPVTVGGVTIKRVTLNSANYILQNKVHEGCILVITRSGGVIPKVVKVVRDKSKKATLPKFCPYCNKVTNLKGAHLYCSNVYCFNSIVAYITYMIKDVLKIKNVGEPTVYQEFINYSVDYPLNFDQLIVNFMTEKFGVKEIKLSDLIQFLNVEGVGKTHAKNIAMLYKTRNNFIEDIGSYDTMKGKIADRIVSKFLIQTSSIRSIAGAWHAFVNDSMQSMPKKIVVLTGTFSIGRASLIRVLNKYSIEVKSSVTKIVDCVLVGKEPGKTKIAKAEQYGIQVLDLSDFVNFDAWLTAHDIPLEEVYEAIDQHEPYVDI